MYTLNLQTAQEIYELLDLIDKESDQLPHPILNKIKEKAEKLNNMKQFLKENL